MKKQSEFAFLIDPKVIIVGHFEQLNSIP